MFPPKRPQNPSDAGLPRASGGVSNRVSYQKQKRLSSPRKRGCFRIENDLSEDDPVFPAQAGVFLSPTASTSTCSGLPRASGGVSHAETGMKGMPLSSPRKRGCFCLKQGKLVEATVFPAQAGVFLSSSRRSARATCLPRASGGVSEATGAFSVSDGSSPRKRGCFRSVHAMGTNHWESSPRKRGCFSKFKIRLMLASGLPRASGGVSFSVALGAGLRMCSPPMQIRQGEGRVFPAQAGVFPN